MDNQTKGQPQGLPLQWCKRLVSQTKVWAQEVVQDMKRISSLFRYWDYCFFLLIR